MQSQKKIIFTTVILVLGIVAVILVPKKRASRQPKTTAYDEAKTSSPTVPIQQDRIPKQTEVPSPTFTPTPIPTLKPDMLRIRLEDALGDPIRGATLSIAGVEYECPTGTLQIEKLQENRYEVKAYADDYAPISKNIELPSHNDLLIQMEYLSSLEALVLNNKGVPVEDATVQLWNGPEVNRPLRDSISIIRKHQNWDLYEDRIQLKRSDNDIYVADTPSMVRLYDRGLMEMVIPQSGSTVVKLGGNYRSPASSYRLRLWDSLSALCNDIGDDIDVSFSLVFASNNVISEEFIYTIGSSNCGELVVSATTNQRGLCRFENLPPQIFYITAIKDELGSGLCKACPAQGNIQLELQKRESCVFVSARRQGVEFFKERSIHGAEAKLEALNSLSLFTGSTMAYNCNSNPVFERVPYGDYKLTIIPPRSANTIPAAKTINVSINQPATYVSVAFDLKEKYSVSGKVICIDTNEPVRGYPLTLMCDLNRAPKKKSDDKSDQYKRTQIPQKWTPYAFTITSNDGSFVFQSVSPGEYMLESRFSREKSFNGYVPSGEIKLESRKNLQAPISSFWVEDRDIQNIEYYVVPGSWARFLGDVVTSSGDPVFNAEVFLTIEKKVYDCRTGKDGSFDLSVFMPNSTKAFSKELEAMWRRNTYERITFIKDGFELQGATERGGERILKNSVPITFKAGDTIQDIHIVLTIPEMQGPVLSGTIRTPDGNVPEMVQLFEIHCIQRRPEHDNLSNLGFVNEDGTYKAYLKDFIPGPFEIIVRFNYPHRIDDNGKLRTPRSSVSYLLPKEFESTLPEGEENLSFDIVIEKGTYIFGKVTDQYGRPAEGAYVRPEVEVQPQNPSSDFHFPHPGLTDSEGLFLLNGLQPGATYLLKVYGSPSDVPKKHVSSVSSGIKPPVDDLVIKIQKDD